jgi:hypothetical protein
MEAELDEVEQQLSDATETGSHEHDS